MPDANDPGVRPTPSHRPPPSPPPRPHVDCEALKQHLAPLLNSPDQQFRAFGHAILVMSGCASIAQ